MGKIVKWAIVAVIILVLFYILGILYLDRPQTGYVFTCENPELPITQCDYRKANFHYDSMDGIYYLDRMYAGAETIKFVNCLLATYSNKIGTCKDPSGKEWTLILSGAKF